MAYDNDGLLIGAGNFAITRDAGNGLPTRVFGAGFDLGRGFNGYDERDVEEVRVNGQPVST
jgi:hypothetical protein